MSALARAAEHLRAARREFEASVGEVPETHADDLRHLAAAVQVVRADLEELRRVVGDVDDEPRGAA